MLVGAVFAQTAEAAGGGSACRPDVYIIISVVNITLDMDVRRSLGAPVRIIGLSLAITADAKDQANLRPAHRPRTVDNTESDINTSHPTGNADIAAVIKEAARPNGSMNVSRFANLADRELMRFLRKESG